MKQAEAGSPIKECQLQRRLVAGPLTLLTEIHTP
jgi:hypothetical protein